MSANDDDGRGRLAERFTAEDIEAFRDVFHEFDRDGDETIDTAELGAVFAELGQVVPPEMIEEMILTVDTDQTGSIEFDEFLELMARKTLGEMQEEVDLDDPDIDEAASTAFPEDVDTALELLSVQQLKHRLSVLKGLRLGLKVFPPNYTDPANPNTAHSRTSGHPAAGGSPQHSTSTPAGTPGAASSFPPGRPNEEQFGGDDVVSQSGGGAGGSPGEGGRECGGLEEGEGEAAEGGEGGEEEEEEVESIPDADALRVLGEQKLFDAGLREDSEGWGREEIAQYVERLILRLDQLVFEEEGYIEVHCEDTDIGDTADETHKFTLGDAEAMEQELLGFEFHTEISPALTTGAEAFARHHTQNPYASVPERTILPRLTDACLLEKHGLLDLNLQSVDDRYVKSLSEVIRRDAMRESHPAPECRRTPLIRHIDMQRNFVTAQGASELIDALLTKGCVVNYLDLSSNPIGGRAGLVPRGDAGTHKLYGYHIRQTAEATLPPGLIDAASHIVATGRATVGGSAPQPPASALAAPHELISEEGRTCGELLGVNPYALSLAAAHVVHGVGELPALGGAAGGTGGGGAGGGGGVEHNHGDHRAEGCASCMVWRSSHVLGEALQHLLSGSSQLGSLGVLRLANTRLTDTDAIPLCESLAENGTLHELDLSHNELGYPSAAALSDMLQANGDLRILKVGWNRFTAAGASHLIEKGLAANGSLEEVDLSWAGVQDHPPGMHTAKDGGGKLLGRLIGSAFLKKINASHNNIGPDGAAAIAHALKSNSTLAQLSLAHNPLATQGVRDILKSLKENSTLESLDLSATSAGPSVKDSRLGEPAEEELREVLAKRDAVMKRTSSGSLAQEWQPGESSRLNCSLHCPVCDVVVRSTHLHDSIEGVDHKLEGRQQTDQSGMATGLRCKIQKLQCHTCQQDQPLAAACLRCGAVFCDPAPNGIIMTFAQDTSAAHGRYPSPPGPERGYSADDLPKTFHLVTRRVTSASKSKGAKAGGKKASGKGKGKSR